MIGVRCSLFRTITNVEHCSRIPASSSRSPTSGCIGKWGRRTHERKRQVAVVIGPRHTGSSWFAKEDNRVVDAMYREAHNKGTGR